MFSNKNGKWARISKILETELFEILSELSFFLKSSSQNRAEPLLGSITNLSFTLFLYCSECDSGWSYVKGECYLFKQVDKRDARRIEDLIEVYNEDCTDEKSCKKTDEVKKISKSKKKLALLPTKSTSDSSDSNVKTTATKGVAE